MQQTIKGLIVTLRQSAIKHLKKDYKKIDLLEALNAFYQIRGIVIQESSKHPCRIEEAFLGLHQRFFDLIQEHFQEEDLKEDDFLNFMNIIDTDIYRIIDNTNIILTTTYKIRNLFAEFREKISSSKD